MSMKKDTLLTEHLDLADQKPMYDNICKKILSNKMILAWIMKECAPEYQDIEVEDIAEKYIEGEPNVSSINVTSGESIDGLPGEDIGINEGKIVYDIGRVPTNAYASLRTDISAISRIFLLAHC